MKKTDNKCEYIVSNGKYDHHLLSEYQATMHFYNLSFVFSSFIQVRQGSPIPTPEPTPPSSPIPLPSREPSPTPRDRIPTPEVSEMGEGASGGAESETESLKDLMQDTETSREGENENLQIKY